MNLITIGSYITPAPTAYAVTASDLDSSETGRNEAGQLIRERIRADVYKITASWRLSTDELILLASAISSTSFSVKFFYPSSGYYQTKNMYAGDRSLTLVSDLDGEDESMWDFSVNFTEY